MFCREQAARLKEIHPILEARNIGVVAIGNGTHFMSADFVEQFNIPFPVYTDPSKQTYEWMQMHRGVGIGLKTLFKGFQARKEGHKQGDILGDVWQQGGEALFAKGGALLWKHANHNADEHSNTEELLKVINTFLP